MHDQNSPSQTPLPGSRIEYQVGTPMPAPEKAPHEPEIPRLIANLEAEAQHMDELLDSLDQRLGPVQTPGEPQEATCAVSTPALTGYGGRLQAIIDRNRRISDRLNGLTMRLEL